MTFENTVNPPLAELEHHGVKGMKWGVRRANQALATNTLRRSMKLNAAVGSARDKVSGTTKETRFDAKRLAKVSGSRSKEAKSVRADIAAKQLASPEYKAALKKAKANRENAELAKALGKFGLKMYAAYKVADIVTGGGSTASAHRSRGQSFVKDNPNIMRAKVNKDGSFKVFNG